MCGIFKFIRHYKAKKMLLLTSKAIDKRNRFKSSCYRERIDKQQGENWDPQREDKTQVNQSEKQRSNN